MKKILLAFMGMVFFAHMVHAANTVFYKLIRKDAMNEQHIIYPNGKGGLYNGYSGWVNYSDVASQYVSNTAVRTTACKFAGWERTPSSTYPENSQYNRGIIECDLTRMAKDTDEDGVNNQPYLFWQWSGQESRGENPCQDYFDAIYGQNALKTPQCFQWYGYYNNFRILKSWGPSDGYGSWWVFKHVDWGYPAAWVRHVLVNEYLSGNENVSWSDVECNAYADEQAAKDCARKMWSTIMDPAAFVTAMKSKDLRCRKPDGSFLTDGSKVKVTRTRNGGTSYINVTREDCPMTYYDGSHTTAYVEFFSQSHCNAAKARNPNTSTGCDKKVASMPTTLSFNTMPCRDFTGKRTNCGDTDRMYEMKSYIFKCKKAYNQIWGSKLQPDCYAVYGLTFKDSYQTGWSYGNYTQNITTAKSTAQSYYPEMTCKWDGKSDSFNYGHDEYVTGNLVCTCKANTFLGEDACNASITDSDRQYCEYDSNNGYCGWRLKSCADWSGERYRSESACKYARNKSNRILTTYCINRKDGACNWSLETATNTVEQCKGNNASAYFGTYDSGRACRKTDKK